MVRKQNYQVFGRSYQAERLTTLYLPGMKQSMARLRVGIAGILAVVAMHMAVANAANNPQFIPLNDYIGQGQGNDPVALGYVAIRCSALYLVFTAMLDGETAPERQQQKASFFEASEKFQGVALKMEMAGTTTALKEAAQHIGQTLTAMSLLYKERIIQTKNLTNNMFDDFLIAGDYSTCQKLAQVQLTPQQQHQQYVSDKILGALPHLKRMEETVRSIAGVYQQFESGSAELLQNRAEMEKLNGLNSELSTTLNAMKDSMKGTGIDLLAQMDLKPANPNLSPVGNYQILTEDLGKILQAEAFIQDWKKEIRQ